MDNLIQLIEGQTKEINALKETILNQRNEIDEIKRHQSEQESRISRLDDHKCNDELKQQIINQESRLKTLETQFPQNDKDKGSTDKIPTVVERLNNLERSTHRFNNKSSAQNQGRSRNELIIMGIEECSSEETKTRFDYLKSAVTKCVDTLGCNTEETITEYFRLGKYSPNKKRPVLLRINTIWAKRRLLNEFSKQKHEGLSLNFTLRENTPMTAEYKSAKSKASELNLKEKERAERSKEEVKISYSARHTGHIFKYEFLDGKWMKTNELPPSQL